MNELRSPRRLFKIWHRRDKALIDHLVGSIGGSHADATGRTHSPMTSSGLPVEEQVRKAWQPCGVGLPIF
jgi:hypothetical protein